MHVCGACVCVSVLSVNHLPKLKLCYCTYTGRTIFVLSKSSIWLQKCSEYENNTTTQPGYKVIMAFFFSYYVINVNIIHSLVVF